MIHYKKKQIGLKELEGGSRNARYKYDDDRGSNRSILSPRSQRSGYTKDQPERGSQRSGYSKTSAALSKKSHRSENSQTSKGGTSKGGPRPQKPYIAKPKTDFVKINVNDWQVFRLQITPFCCRTRYQKSLARMFKKGQYRLHKELEVGSMLKSIRESKYPMRSLANTPAFNPPDVIKQY